MGLFFKKKKKEPPKPQQKKRTDFNVVSTEPETRHIRYDLTKYNEYWNERGEDGDFIYKYESNVDSVELKSEGNKILVYANSILIGHIADDKVEEARRIMAGDDVDIVCLVSGGEYKEYEGRKAIKGEEPYSATIMMRHW